MEARVEEGAGVEARVEEGVEAGVEAGKETPHYVSLGRAKCFSIPVWLGSVSTVLHYNVCSQLCYALNFLMTLFTLKSSVQEVATHCLSCILSWRSER